LAVNVHLIDRLVGPYPKHPALPGDHIQQRIERLHELLDPSFFKRVVHISEVDAPVAKDFHHAPCTCFFVFAECARVLHPGGRFAALDATVPSNPLLRAGNAVWFRGAVPLLGRVVAHDAEAYRYLPKSTAYLPAAPELAARLGDAGFRDVRHTTLTGGSVLLLTGTRA